MNTKQQPASIIQVALPTPAGDWFDYSPGNIPIVDFKPGCRVKVPFGSRQLIGIIKSIQDNSSIPQGRLKPVLELLDKKPVFPTPVFKLMQRASNYYHHPLGEVLAAALPSLLRQGKPLDHTELTAWQAVPMDDSGDLKQLKRAPKQRACLELLLEYADGLSEDQLSEELPGWRSSIRALEKKKLVTTHRRPCQQPAGNQKPQPGPSLNTEQQAAVATITEQFSGFSTTLLEGVTGSGKTEVYLHLISKIIQQNKQVLVLVPEISLTPQLKQRFETRLGIPIVSLHSAMNDSERLCAWQLASNGDASIVIGTRSAVFVPLKSPGLIVVDEEHDTSFKQQEGFRYHARDLAVLRGQLEKLPVVLGSATPSLETLAKAKKGDYQHLRLTRRAGNAQPPRFTLVDLRREQRVTGLSVRLIHRMREELALDHQVLLFINRRGFAPALLCHDCGHIFDCPRCDAHTTFHAAANELRCHHCGHRSRPPVLCPDCGGNTMTTTGVGTEQIEKNIHEIFPNEKTIRIDRDTMRKKNALKTALSAIEAKQYNIIIGTQLLAKGHDFPDITLVAIIDVDQGLYSIDFRAPERLAQQILQVGGRAGRGSKTGEVIIQTHQPEHPLLQTLLQEDFNAFSSQELRLRSEAGLPPSGYLALIRTAATKPEDAIRFLQEARNILLQYVDGEVQVMGPVPAPMEKRAGRFRQQLLLQAETRPVLHRLIQRTLPSLKELKSSRKTRWNIDIDPIEMS